MKTLFENSEIFVRLNSSNEVFYLNKRSGVELRIGNYGERTKVTADGARWIPTSAGGLSCMEFVK
jgi:hypothetical protein